MTGTDALARAVEYVRMSTDRQEYSTEYQSAANHAYAASRGMEIVRTYADEGKSGLTFGRRNALKQLITDVQSGDANFSDILVYDVSRWGRFQDADESGYYEYICKRAGIKVHYCAEQFENDGSPLAAIVKAIKRAMAAEYSRDLSVRSFVGQSHIFQLGYRAGATPAYATRRLLVDSSGASKGILKLGEQKNIKTDRVLLVLGPPEEVRIVRWIFSAFVSQGKPEREIVKILNRKGISSGAPMRPWTYARVRKLLQNEVYLGESVWNRTSIKLGKKKVRNPPELWLRGKCSFAGIIDPRRFDDARDLICARRIRPSDEDVLQSLRQLYRKHGFLDTKLINRCKRSLPGLTNLYRRFGGLRQIHKLIGSTGRPGTNYGVSDEQLLNMLRRLLEKRGYLNEAIIERSKGIPCPSTFLKHFGSLWRAYELIGYQPEPVSHQGSWARTHGLSDSQLLEALRKLLGKFGYLTEKLIDHNGKTPTAPTYSRRFGSLTRAYELVGYAPPPRGNGYTGSRRIPGKAILATGHANRAIRIWTTRETNVPDAEDAVEARRAPQQRRSSSPDRG